MPEARDTILNVDDNMPTRYARTRVLRSAGYEVLEADSGEAAWSMIAESPPSLVILDVRLPDVSGLEICRRIKGEHPSVFVLQISALLITSADRIRGLDSGADSYLVEPIEPEELLASIRALMRLRRAEEQLRQLNDDLEGRVAARTRELADTNARLVTEIEDRERVEEQLRQAHKNEALGQLTGGIAHDFNNLLTVILGGVELATKHVDGDRARALLSNVAQAGQQAARLTAQLLSYARRQHFIRRNISIAAVLRALEGFLQQSIGPLHRIALDLPEEEDWLVFTDRSQIESLILNLLINARDAMPDGGTIEVRVDHLRGDGGMRVRVSGEMVALTVADTGVGMTEEVRAKAFDPFFTTKAAGRGTGLGLSMVYGIAKQSGGDVDIRTRPGEGAAVTVYLPRAAVSAAEADPEAGEAERAGQTGLSAMAVLLVEDNPLVLAYTRDLLTADGHLVSAYGDGTKALRDIDAGLAYDVAVVDYAMPGMNGEELVRELRRRHPRARAVVMTGFADPIVLEQLARDHVVLRKPYSILDMRAAMASARPAR